MKNFKKLILVVALASIISSPVSAINFSDMKYNVRKALGFVSPVEQAQREVGVVATEIKNEAIEAGVSATADILKSLLPESLKTKIDTKNLVVAAGSLTIVGFCVLANVISIKLSAAK